MDQSIPEGMKPSPFLSEPERYNIEQPGSSLVRMNLFPASENGHLLIVPKDSGKQNPFQLSREELRDHAKLMLQATEVLKKGLPGSERPDGFTIGWNVGLAGGQTIAHSHAHVYGRKAGDNGGIPVRGGIARVLPTDDPFYSDKNQPLESLDKLPTLRENMYARVVRAPHPVVPGHVLILPKHLMNGKAVRGQSKPKEFTDLTPDEITDMVHEAEHYLRDLRHAEPSDMNNPYGANIGWNVGRSAGQTYTSSAVMEVIPRQLGDVEKPRGGICMIKPPTDIDYYKGLKTGVATDSDGKTVTGDLSDERGEHYSNLTQRFRTIWPKGPACAISA